MADVDISYRNSVIGSLSNTGSLTLQTQGKYCDDDITVDYTKSGGALIEPFPVAFLTGGSSGTTWANVLTSGQPHIEAVLDDYFSYYNGEFTCKVPGTYSITFYARGSYSSGGAARYVHYQILKNGTVLYSETGNVYPNGGGNGGYTNISLSAGDVLTFTTKNNTGATANTLSIIITKTA